MESAPLVSVVTPFYNTRNYLAECIESVLRQTYQNWEYVLIDNCSNDGSTEIATQYASRFPEKIRLIRTESFLSQVQNYNFALSCISPDGKYCKMAQADDYLFPDCIRSMVETAETNPSLGIVAAYELEGDEVHLDGLPFPRTVFAGRYIGRLYFLRGTFVFGTPTSVLIRSEIIRSRKPFYDERYAPFEDCHACFDLCTSWDFGFIHQVLTYSRRDNGGIIASVSRSGLLEFLRFTNLVAHGRDFLSSDEYDRCLKRAEREYFLYLAKSACALRTETQEFWQFHQKGLASINYSLDWKTLVKWLPRAFLEKGWTAFWRMWDKESPLGADSRAFQTPTREKARKDRSSSSIPHAADGIRPSSSK